MHKFENLSYHMYSIQYCEPLRNADSFWEYLFSKKCDNLLPGRQITEKFKLVPWKFTVPLIDITYDKLTEWDLWCGKSLSDWFGPRSDQCVKYKVNGNIHPLPFGPPIEGKFFFQLLRKNNPQFKILILNFWKLKKKLWRFTVPRSWCLYKPRRNNIFG